ncbi:hypothetical protein C2S51_018305 [Perilla frutescens var. frutescens]|nr:hypothetical protein C2S51_018305 [Perilla frutescens var. frutescens]
MGFGNLFHINIIEVPTTLAFWVLDNFDARRCEIKLQENRRVHIEACDVHRVLGLPNGDCPIKKMKKKEKCNLLDAWRGLFRKKNGRIVASDVAKKMIELKDGGVWFKRHFVLLLIACLIEHPGNGYITPQIMSNLEDMSKVHELEWCEYVMRSLVKHKLEWEKNKMKYFTGPILFLTAFYVDRVVLCRRTVSRTFPIVKNWTYLLMKKRENEELRVGSFGWGYPEESIIIEQEPAHSNNPYGPYASPDPTCKKSSAIEKNNEDNETNVDSDEFSMKAKAKLKADTMVEIMQMVRGAPKHMFGTVEFNKILEATHEMLKCFDRASTSHETPPAHNQMNNTQTDDEFWENEERLALIDEIETTMIKKQNALKIRADDIPSFSLGLTQDEWGGIDNVIRDIDAMMANDLTEDGPCVKKSQTKSGERVIEVGSTNNDVPIESDAVRNQWHTTSGKDKEKMRPDEKLANEDNNEHIQCEQSTMKSKLKLRRKVKIVKAPTHQMEMRNRGIVRKTDKLMSPFIIRVTDMSSKISNVERDLWFWIFHKKDANIEDIVFYNERVALRRKDIMTMRGNIEISNNVLDAWSSIMNHRELSRAPDSPCRFYASTKPCCFTIDEWTGIWDSPPKKRLFFLSMDDEIKNSQGMKLGDIDMFFFPLYEQQHFQVLCFDVNKFRMDLLDNTTPSGCVNKASDISFQSLLTNFFIEYLAINGLREKAVGLRNAVLTILELPWGGINNYFDCWIFVMRHMETYMGGGIKNWSIGLRKIFLSQLKKVRVKYCAEILSAVNNVHKSRNIDGAKWHFRVSCEDGIIKVADLLKDI